MVKSQDAVLFERRLQDMLRIYSSEIREFKKTFDEKKHCIHAELIFFFPAFELITKQGIFKRRMNDVDNMLKTTIDSIFRGIDIEDSFVISAKGTKMPSDKHLIDVHLWIDGMPRAVPAGIRKADSEDPCDPLSASEKSE